MIECPKICTKFSARVRRPPHPHRADSGPAEAGGRSGWPGLSVTSDLTARYHECYTFHYMASSLQPASFRLEPALLAALQAIKERDGVPVSEQVRRALQAWIETRGVEKAAPRRAATRRKA